MTEWDSVLLQCLWSVKHCPPCSPSVCYVRKFSLFTVSVIGQLLSTVCTICLLSEEVQFVTVSDWSASDCVHHLLCEEIQFVTVSVTGQLLTVFTICCVRKFSLLLCLWLVSFCPLCAPSVCYLRRFSLLLCLWLVSFCPLCAPSVCYLRKFSLLLCLWSVSFCLCLPSVYYVRKFSYRVWLVNCCPLGLLSVYMRIFTLVPFFFFFSLFFFFFWGGGGGGGFCYCVCDWSASVHFF